MNVNLSDQVNPRDIISILNNNVIKDDNKKLAMVTMGLSSCNVACLSYQCCTAHGCGGNHIQHSNKINNQ